ncbi:MAG: tripartite tricarboxylate transporter TctB family protein [Pseudomonadota bacterium]
MALNRDVLVAIALLVITGGLMVASFDIREPDYGQLSPAAWPRAILVTMIALSVIYLIQSLRAGPDETPRPADLAPGLRGFVSYWRNVISVFVLFLGYLLAIPYVGMLVGGVAFVFLLLTALGGFRSAPLHLVIAGVTMGGVWTLFTYALEVFLPRGDWTGF